MGITLEDFALLTPITQNVTHQSQQPLPRSITLAGAIATSRRDP
jgi:hypothetical protein